MNVNYDVVTVQDCIELYEMKKVNVVLNDGKVSCFVSEMEAEQ